MILVSKNPILLPFPWMLVAFWLTVFTSTLGLICVIHSWWQSWKESRQPIQLLAVLFVLVLLVGCCGKLDSMNYSVDSDISETSTATPITPTSIVFSERMHAGSLLLFDKQIQDYGKFQVGRDYFKEGHGGSKVEFKFPFKVGEKNVVIEKIDPSCGCIVSDSPVIGQNLLAGSEHNLKLTMDLYGRCGEFISFVNIVTKPESKEPIMLKMTVFAKQLPEVVPTGIRCRGIVGKNVEKVELNVHYLRDESVDKMELDFENSDFGAFKIVHSELVSDVSLLQPKEVHDRALLQLESEQHYVLGLHEETFTVCFKRDFEPITVPVKIQVVPPITLAVERLFLGEVEPGEEKAIPVRVIFNDPDQKPTVQIISTDENVQVRFDEQTMRLHVTVKAPQESGRFENTMRLTFDADDSAFNFPISGIVQKK